ncbi:hypothetical protein DFJ74DRAFT_694115 [Hyaloraphidium curvatum]|nr:hypothetical protein DFJ74DRAFT_694115 [Hyaloraphidium curvatum]
MEAPATFTVQYDRRKLTVNMPLDRPLAALRDLLAKETGLPPERQKLFCSGVVMADDGASLRRYIRPGSRLMLIATGPKDAPAPPPKDSARNGANGAGVGRHGPGHQRHHGHKQPAAGSPSSTREEESIRQLDAALAQAKQQYLPMLDGLSAAAKAFAADQTLPPPRELKLPPHVTMRSHLLDMYGRVTEGLMKVLLEIDNVQLEDGEEEARAKRRQAVKLVQDFLDRADSIKGSIPPV